MSVCAWAPVSAVPRYSWLGCWGVCACVRAPRLYPAIPGFGVLRGCVCLHSGPSFSPSPLAGVLGCAFLCARSACTPPLLAGVCGVGVCAWAQVSAAPRHSWLGCAVWVCVLVLGFRLRPASPGWGVGVCVCLCLRSACTPPLLAGVCGVGVGAWAPVSAAPRHSWLGCWGSVCACVRASDCIPPLLAGVCGVGVCAWAPVSAAPRHSWLGCAVWVCVLGLGFRLRPATPGWGVGVCLCLCVRSACTPPLLAGVCGVGVGAWAQVLAAARHSWLGCWGSVCACLRASACTLPLLVGVCGVAMCAWARVVAGPRHS